MKPIAHIHSLFPEKFGVPRQAGLVGTKALVVFEPQYRVAEAVRGLEEFDYVWLVWQFHLVPEDDAFRPTIRPPRLGGNKRVGVFASRSPFRPNPIGLSAVRLLEIEYKDGPVLLVEGADLVDGTPILDIKPYLPYADSHPEARSGFAADRPAASLAVSDPKGALDAMPKEEARALVATIEQDPRPHYHDNPERVYSLLFGTWEVRFKVADAAATILSVVLNNVKTDSGSNTVASIKGDEKPV